MEYFERKYRDAEDKFEYLMRKMREIVESPAGTDHRSIAWEALNHIYDEAFKPLETKQEEKERDAA